jgi:hypothetical protein
MKTIFLFSTVAFALSGCYVAPIQTSYPSPPYSPPAQTQHVIVTAPPAPPAPVTIQIRLYPVNEAAAKMGQLNATLVDTHDPQTAGRVSVVVGRDLLTGEASRVSTSVPFGGVYKEVYGTLPEGTSGVRGIANASSPSGSFARCEYIMRSIKPASGVGACVFGNGAKYQLHFN